MAIERGKHGRRENVALNQVRSVARSCWQKHSDYLPLTPAKGGATPLSYRLGSLTVRDTRGGESVQHISSSVPTASFNAEHGRSANIKEDDLRTRKPTWIPESYLLGGGYPSTHAFGPQVKCITSESHATQQVVADKPRVLRKQIIRNKSSETIQGSLRQNLPRQTKSPRQHS